jgi:nitrite reductase (NADH) small subunit
VKVCAAEDIPRFEGRRTRIKSSYVGVFHAEDGFYAIGDVCPHRGGPLSDESVAGTEVSCPLHNRRVELKTGNTKDEPLCRVPAFPVEVRDGTVYVDASALQGSLV